MTRVLLYTLQSQKDVKLFINLTCDYLTTKSSLFFFFKSRYIQPVHIQEGTFQNIRTFSSNQVQTNQSLDENFYEVSDIIVNENLEHSPFEAEDHDRVPPYLELQPEAENISRTSDGYEKVE